MASNSSSKVTRSRFELEKDGYIAYLEFETDDRGWITFLHTEVPVALQKRGVASTLVGTALEYARENRMKVDIVCPVVAAFIDKHPEFKPSVP
jgi:predicted GNAT family acetyltransferase